MTLSRSLRTVVAEDSDQLFDWVNRPDSLIVKAQTQNKIPRAIHDAWFTERLFDKYTQMHIIEYDGATVGQVRLQRDVSLDAYMVDIYIEPESRGKGLATWSLLQVIGKLHQVFPDSKILAVVRVENTSSSTLFQHAGFREQERSREFITYVRSSVHE